MTNEEARGYERRLEYWRNPTRTLARTRPLFHAIHGRKRLGDAAYFRK